MEVWEGASRSCRGQPAKLAGWAAGPINVNREGPRGSPDGSPIRQLVAPPKRDGPAALIAGPVAQLSPRGFLTAGDWLPILIVVTLRAGDPVPRNAVHPPAFSA